MILVRLEPAAPRSPVKQSTTEPLRSLRCRLVQSIQLGFIFSWKQVTTILSNTYLTGFSKNLVRIVWSKQFERVKVLLERIISCLYEVLAENRHISTVWAVSSLP